MAIVDQRQLLGEWHAICVQFSFVTRWRLPMDPFDFLMAEDLWLPANEAKAGPVDEIDLQSDDDARCTQIKRRRPKRTAGDPRGGVPREPLALDGPTPMKKRRRAAGNNAPIMSRLAGEQCMDLPSVIVQSEHNKTQKSIAIPLWPQYVVGNGGFQSDSDARWLRIGNYEQWFSQLTHALTPANARANAKALKDSFYPKFRDAVLVARNALVDGKTLASASDTLGEDDCHSDSDEGETVAVKIPYKIQPTLGITIGEFSITCLNCARPCVVKVDEKTAAFLVSYLLPSVKSALGPSRLQSTPPVTRAPFLFETSGTPNIRDKVAWSPQQHAWKLSLQKPTRVVPPNRDAVGESLCVDPRLDVQHYADEKAKVYARALRAWNELDGSTRFRIPVPNALWSATLGDGCAR